MKKLRPVNAAEKVGAPRMVRGLDRSFEDVFTGEQVRLKADGDDLFTLRDAVIATFGQHKSSSLSDALTVLEVGKKLRACRESDEVELTAAEYEILRAGVEHNSIGMPLIVWAQVQAAVNET